MIEELSEGDSMIMFIRFDQAVYFKEIVGIGGLENVTLSPTANRCTSFTVASFNTISYALKGSVWKFVKFRNGPRFKDIFLEGNTSRVA